MVRVAIDPNVRIGRRGTLAGFEDVDDCDPAMLAPGTAVEVHEDEAGICGLAVVTGVDAEQRLVYLDVEWSELADVPMGHDSVGKGAAPGGISIRRGPV